MAGSRRTPLVAGEHRLRARGFGPAFPAAGDRTSGGACRLHCHPGLPVA